MIVTRVPPAPPAGVKLVIVGATANEVVVVTDDTAVVTVIGPVVAAAGTVAVIEVPPLFTVNDVAAVPLKSTCVAPWKLKPEIVTVEPEGPLAGLNGVVANRGAAVKFDPLVPVPSDDVTVIGPVSAVAGTTAVICVSLSTVNELAETPPNCTCVAPVKRMPVTVTDVPLMPLVGVKLSMRGPVVSTVYVDALVAVPDCVVTEIEPVTAPAGTVAVICVSLSALNPALTLFENFTELTKRKFIPVTTTWLPTTPIEGLNPLMVGAGGRKRKPFVFFAKPPSGFVTTTSASAAACGGVVAWMDVDEPNVTVAAAVPPNMTVADASKFVPMSVTTVPPVAGPEAGLTVVSVGGAMYVNVVCSAWPSGLTMRTVAGPTAPGGV